MKFGVFLPNGSNGYVLSDAIKPYFPTYDHLSAISIEAENQGLSFALPMIKFKGFGGSTGFWDHCFCSCKVILFSLLNISLYMLTHQRCVRHRSV